MNIPEDRYDRIATDILKQDRNRIISPESNTNQKDLSMFIGDSDEDEEGPLTEVELDESIKDFEKFYFELRHEGRRENIGELMDILGIWRDSGEISLTDYLKVATIIEQC